MSTSDNKRGKYPKGPLVITKHSPKKTKFKSLDIDFTTINHIISECIISNTT